jgi:hypothetical protein
VVHLGNHFGFKTINIVRRRAAVQELLELGGTEVIGTYPFRYSRSTHSTSSATCPSSTSLMFVTLTIPAA